jgi:hypothetical protein
MPAQPPPMSPPPERKWYDATWLLILTLFFCFPAFLVLLWRRPMARSAKVIITAAVVAIATVGGIAAASKHSSTTSPTPTVTGVSNLCSQYYDTLIRTAHLPDSQVRGPYKALATAARPYDSEIANDLNAIGDASTVQALATEAAKVSQRCVELGYPPSAEQFARMTAGIKTPNT